MKLIVGLGNPGDKYRMTRHNVGFLAVDHFGFKEHASFVKKSDFEIVQTNVNGEKVILLKPLTFMNNSGTAVSYVMKYYKIAIEDVLIVYDDLDMEFGKLKMKKNSSSGGHNGIKSIIQHLKSENFLRLKVGITNEYKRNAADFVLGNFSKSEQTKLDDVFNVVDQAIYDFIAGSDYNTLMNLYNKQV